MNRIDRVLNEKQEILNIYFTAGYPQLHDTLRIAATLERAGVDMLEIGIPFSDPVADGPTIQASSHQALENGMTLRLLFEQLATLRKDISIPVLLMGYLNPIFQYGMERFCEACASVGVDGVIIPDMPMEEYLDQYQQCFLSHGVYNIFLISPHTSEKRIHQIDENTGGFIYLVSSSSITGAKKSLEQVQLQYFDRIKSMHLCHPRLIGFGISDSYSFHTACQYAHGAIVGSAFINQLQVDASDKAIKEFINRIKGS